MLSTITNAITSVFSNEAAKDAIINAAITKAAGGSDRAAITAGLGTFASQEYGIPGIPGTGTVPDPTANAAKNQIAANIAKMKQMADLAAIEGNFARAKELQDSTKILEKQLADINKQITTTTTPTRKGGIGDYFGLGGLEGLKSAYGKDSVFDKFPGGIGGLAAMGVLGKAVYDDYKKREKGIAATPQVMMDSLGRYQLASDMGTGGTRGEFGLGPKPSVLKVAGGGEINRQYFSEGGIAELDMRDGGESEGPGTGTSDDIPAMLSDGEYVMTAKATRGAGAFDLSKSDSGITLVKTDNPDRERGVANMRELMNIFEEI